MNEFFVPFCLITHLGYIFLLDVSIFTTVDEEKEEKVNCLSILGEFYLKMQRKIWKFINSVDSQQQEYLKIELHKKSEEISEIKLPSLLPSVQNSHLITQTRLVLNIFYFILIIALPLFKF